MTKVNLSMTCNRHNHNACKGREHGGAGRCKCECHLTAAAIYRAGPADALPCGHTNRCAASIPLAQHCDDCGRTWKRWNNDPAGAWQEVKVITDPHMIECLFGDVS